MIIYVDIDETICETPEERNYVMAVPILENIEKINALNKGILPIYEPGLEEILKRNYKQKRLIFTNNLKEAVENSDIIFICVGTPTKKNSNSADLKYVFEKLVFDLMNAIVDAKLIIMRKLDELKQMKTFVLTRNGFKVTGQEGFVAINDKGGAVKLVDRLEFSYNNFSPDTIKGWQR